LKKYGRINVAKKMTQEGKLTQEKAEEFLRRLEEFHKSDE